MRIALFILFLFHGLIHYLGFFKAFHLTEVPQLTQPISKPSGLLWFFAGLLIILAAFGYFMKTTWWVYPAAIGIVLSQVMIITVWQDAKFGSIANFVLGLITALSFMNRHFESSFRKDVEEGLKRRQPETQLIEPDIAHLPIPVQKYLKYTGCLDKPKVQNVKFSFSGQMRDKEKDWFSFTSEQYNFFDKKERLFFMKACVFGLPVHGYHRLKGGEASMLIKLLSIVPVVNLSGKEMLQSETVTFFNDMCFFAPATLIDNNIRWQTIDDHTVEASFSYQKNIIKAKLYFNEGWQLINFESDDRYARVNDQMHNYRFFTPVRDYKFYGGYRLGSFGEAIFMYPDGPFTYGRFHLQKVAYNLNYK